MEQTISSLDLYDTSSASGLVDFFNDPNSAIIFLLGIFISSIFLIACTKVMYGPKKKETPKPVVKTQPKRKPRRKPAPKQGTQQRKPRQPKTKTKQ